MTKACSNCGAPMELEFVEAKKAGDTDIVWTSEQQDDESDQYDNALIIQFDGSYGMFVDDIETATTTGHFGPKAIICHDCAHRLCTVMPGLGKLIDPHNSHSHRNSYMVDHPEHFGWDYDMRDNDGTETGTATKAQAAGN